MKNLHLKQLAVLVALLLLGACGDKKDDPKPMRDLVKGHWYVTALTYEAFGTKEDVMESALESCGMDDEIEFKADSLVTVYEGAKKCGAESSNDGSYTLDESNKKLTVKEIGYEIELGMFIKGTWTIKSMSQAEMVLERPDIFEIGKYELILMKR